MLGIFSSSDFQNGQHIVPVAAVGVYISLKNGSNTTVTTFKGFALEILFKIYLPGFLKTILFG